MPDSLMDLLREIFIIAKSALRCGDEEETCRACSVTRQMEQALALAEQQQAEIERLKRELGEAMRKRAPVALVQQRDAARAEAARLLWRGSGWTPGQAAEIIYAALPNAAAPAKPCQHCAVGTPMSERAGHHWTGNADPPKCDAAAAKESADADR